VKKSLSFRGLWSDLLAIPVSVALVASFWIDRHLSFCLRSWVGGQPILDDLGRQSCRETFLETPHAFRSSGSEKFIDIHAGMALSCKATNSAGLNVRSDFLRIGALDPLSRDVLRSSPS
jgi:hypothetical protein